MKQQASGYAVDNPASSLAKGAPGRKVIAATPETGEPTGYGLSETRYIRP